MIVTGGDLNGLNPSTNASTLVSAMQEICRQLSFDRIVTPTHGPLSAVTRTAKKPCMEHIRIFSNKYINHFFLLFGSWSSAVQRTTKVDQGGKTREERAGSVRRERGEAGGTRSQKQECRIGERAQAANLKQKKRLHLQSSPTPPLVQIKPSRVVRPPGIEKEQNAKAAKIITIHNVILPPQLFFSTMKSSSAFLIRSALP